ncbi:MAG: hypothetical protein CAF43_001510 [Nitrospira sp. CG24C]|nr:MAG: hypothetical protein CAF43_001510 [Nitrospira sp. CG24C]
MVLAVVWLTSGLAGATEPAVVKPEPEVTPAPSKPPGAASETKPSVKAHPPGNGSPTVKARALPKLPATMTGKNGAPMVLVPAGEFTMGSEQGDDDEQPVHRVVLDSFYSSMPPSFAVPRARLAWRLSGFVTNSRE